MAIVVPSHREQFLVRTFYRFDDLDAATLDAAQSRLQEQGLALGARGTILLSHEGCNGTVAATPEGLESLFSVLRELIPGVSGQDSWSPILPFARWKVLIKPQLVGARDQELRPQHNFDDQLDCQAWDQIRSLVRQGRAQMIDVRNHYEVGLGCFPEARNPDTETFKEFSDFLDREVGESLDPSLPTAIYCTGGIRCEKARLDLERRGFQRVLQLEGGILRYLREQPEGGFQGECFVFDQRLALDRHLQPTERFERCPTCGNPRPRGGGDHDCREPGSV